jgi:hypothetical protein
MKQSSKKAWSILTVILISIFFTPIVGGIIAGLNQKRLGFKEKAWREFLISLVAFAWYSIYFNRSDEHAMAAAHLIPQIALYISATMTPIPFFLFLVVPFALIIFLITLFQRKSWNMRMQPINTAPQWSAYLESILLLPVIGIFLCLMNFWLYILVYR